jgi:hypothetical protein
VKLNTVLEGAYQITLTNAVGQKVLNVFNGQMSQGTQKIAIEAVSLSTGVYFLNIEHDGAIKTLKLIKD